jgi:hypothetical protein
LKNRPSFRQGRRNPASKDGKLCVVWMLNQILTQLTRYLPWHWIPASMPE